MINLHQTFNHYLNSEKTIDLQDINERLIAYGWCDDGTDLSGYYILTENHILYYNLENKFVGKESRVCGVHGARR